MNGMEGGGSDFDNVAEPSTSQWRGSINGRACDNCRARKVRCDRENPCSHCLQAKVECTYAQAKPKEKRTRILLTSQYEKKIDLIDLRLNAIIRMLENLESASPRVRATSASDDNDRDSANVPTPASISPVALERSRQTQSGAETPIGDEGDSSLAAQSAFASDFLKNAVSSRALNNGSAMQMKLKEISNIITSMKQQTTISKAAYYHAGLIQRPQHAKRELPPIQKSVALIRCASDGHLAGTGWVYEFLPLQRFSDMCLNVYFTEDYSEADFISVNAGLYSLFGDYAHRCDGNESDDSHQYAQMCRSNLQIALSNISLHLLASPEVVQSLIFGAFHVIELSQPLLAWTLSSKASELCQTLGFHRISPNSSEKPEVVRYKQFLFWSAYFLDKSLSLRLGRASNLPDWDITTEPPSTSDPNQEPVLAYFALWIKAARCQGNIYEMLYSSGSRTQPDHVRQARVETLVSDLRSLDTATKETHKQWLKTAKAHSGEDLMEFFAISDDVLRLSLLTLVYRGAPQLSGSHNTFTLDCVNAARATLARHQDCVAFIRETSDNLFHVYMHWTLLFSPFIPFIVIFCQVLETHDRTDLDRLGAFVDSIKSAPGVSDAAQMMHGLSQSLYLVALEYLKLSESESLSEDMQACVETEMCLAALGLPYCGANMGTESQLVERRRGYGPDFSQFMNASGWPDAGSSDQQRMMNPMAGARNMANLEDWIHFGYAAMGPF